MGVERGVEPIATGELADELRGAVESITAALVVASGEKDPFGSGNLSGGSAGVGLYFAHLAEYGGMPGAAEIAERCFDHAALELSEHELPIALYHGVCGVPWAIDRAYSLADAEGDGEEDEEEEDSELDQVILNTVKTSPWRLDYDLIGGLVGVGVYGLSNPRPLGRAIAAEVVDRLGELVEDDDRGARWLTPAEHLVAWQRERAPNGYYNLGLAHGIPGVIAFLARACAVGVRPGPAGSLYRSGVRWLFDQAAPPSARTRFPAWVRVGGGDDSARFGWCYGDPGVAIAIASAAAMLGDTRSFEQAISLARAAAGLAVSETDVDDPPICHGAAGIAHMFGRLFRLTGEGIFRDAANRWLRDCLDRRRSDGFAGFAAREVDVRGGAAAWRPYPGLLNGAAGIGLVFMTALDSRYSAWDGFLLTDVGPSR